MSEPIYNDMAEEIYAALPDHFHRVDPSYNYHMKKFIASFTPLVDEIDKKIQSYDYIPPEDGGDPNDPMNTSALVDPTKADPKYFPWLAQIYGVRLNTRLGYEEQRQQLINASIGYRSGTPEAIEAAAKTYLIGDRYARVYGRSTPAGRNTGGPWDLLLVTKSSETLKNLFPESVSIAANIGAIGRTAQIVRTNEIQNPSFETATTNWAVVGGSTLSRILNSLLPNTRPTPVPVSSYSMQIDLNEATAISGAQGTFTSDASAPVIQRSNLYTDPSFTTLTGKVAVDSAVITVDTAWAQSGTTSIKVVPDNASSTGTALRPYSSITSLNGFVAGKTYTVSATIRLATTQIGNLSDWARRIVVNAGFGAPAPLAVISEAAPNQPGSYRISATFTVPVGADRCYLALMNGSDNPVDAVWWDALLVEETADLLPYFDGTFATANYQTYSWAGTANASVSRVSLGNVMTFSAYIYLHSIESVQSTPVLRIIDNSSNTYTSTPATQVGWQRMILTAPLPTTSGTITCQIVSSTTNVNTGVIVVDGVLAEQFTRFPYSYFDYKTPSVIAPYKTSNSGTDIGANTQTIYMPSRIASDPEVFAGRAYNIRMGDFDYEIDIPLLDAATDSPIAPYYIGNKFAFALSAPQLTAIEHNPHQLMFKARTDGYTIPLKVAVMYFNSGGTPIAGTEILTPGNLNGSWKQFNIWTGMPPVAADRIQFVFYYDLTDLPPNIDTSNVQLFLSELGARTDPETDWTPLSADPAELVTRLGAKPAGYKLHYAQLVATWDIIESVYPTWNIIDGKTWRTVEESGVDNP